MRVAFQGAPGAFSEAAARALWPASTPVDVWSFADVVRGVERGSVEAGVLPVENSTVGPVDAALAALRSAAAIELSGEVELPVRLHLLGCAGARLAGIRRIAGQPIALAQCRAYLRSCFSITIEEWYDSAAAARAVGEHGNPAVAAIAGESAAQRYRLQVLRRDVHDDAGNSTRFVGIRRRS